MDLREEIEKYKAILKEDVDDLPQEDDPFDQHGLLKDEDEDDLFNDGLEDELDEADYKIPRNRTFRSPVNGPGVKDKNANIVRGVAIKFFGEPYSQARIGPGGSIRRWSFRIKIAGHRFSLRVQPGTPGDFKSLKDITPNVKANLQKMREDFLSKCDEAGVSRDAVDLKFHIGTGLYASVQVKLGEAMPRPVGQFGGAKDDVESLVGLAENKKRKL